MIAFIITKSLVPLIDGLCSTDSISILSFTFTSFALPFRKKKHVKEKKQSVQISSHLPAYICTCVLCTHIWICIYRDLFYLDSSGPAGVSSWPLGSYRVPHVQGVCASYNLRSARDTVRIHASPWCTHDAVAAALSHRHNLIIRLGTGFMYSSHSKLGHWAYTSQISISTSVFAGFLCVCECYIYICTYIYICIYICISMGGVERAWNDYDWQIFTRFHSTCEYMYINVRIPTYTHMYMCICIHTHCSKQT